MLRTLVDEVARAVAAGMTLDETQAGVKLAEFRDAFADADEGMRTAVERAYHEARGEILP